MNNAEAAIIGVKIASKILEIPEPSVYFIESKNLPNKEITGLFIGKDYEIIFNEEWVIKSPQIEVFITCFHEARHAYQLHSIKNGINESKEVLKQWEADFNSYSNPSGKNEPLADIDYLKQSIEIDAIRFAHIQIKELFGVKTVIPEIIKEEIFKKQEEL